MTRSQFIANRAKEVLLDGDWIATTNIKEQLGSITWEQATYKVSTLNTIAALTYHINYYLGGLINVFAGGDLEIRDRYSFDVPEIKSAQDWQMLIADYLSNAKKFVEYVSIMPDGKLDEPFVDEKYGTYQRNIEGIIEHCYYHFGQIVIIRKMIISSNE